MIVDISKRPIARITRLAQAEIIRVMISRGSQISLILHSPETQISIIQNKFFFPHWHRLNGQPHSSILNKKPQNQLGK
jgi:hypothetical protein